MTQLFNCSIAKNLRVLLKTIEQWNNRTIKNISRTYLSHVFWPRIIGYLLVVAIAIPAVLNLYGKIFPEHEQLSKLNQTVLAHPFSPQPHQSLGKYYLDQGYLKLAKHELTLATQLGSLNAARMYDDTQQRRDKIKQETAFWEKELIDKPGYREAYVKLASLYYQLRNSEKAKANLEKARKIDPNYEPVQKLEDSLN